MHSTFVSSEARLDASIWETKANLGSVTRYHLRTEQDKAATCMCMSGLPIRPEFLSRRQEF